jgi:hypothetical protein
MIVIANRAVGTLTACTLVFKSAQDLRQKGTNGAQQVNAARRGAGVTSEWNGKSFVPGVEPDTQKSFSKFGLRKISPRCPMIYEQNPALESLLGNRLSRDAINAAKPRSDATRFSRLRHKRNEMFQDLEVRHALRMRYATENAITRKNSVHI